MSGFLNGAGEAVKKSHNDNLELSENSEFPIETLDLIRLPPEEHIFGKKIFG